MPALHRDVAVVVLISAMPAMLCLPYKFPVTANPSTKPRKNNIP